MSTEKRDSTESEPLDPGLEELLTTTGEEGGTPVISLPHILVRTSREITSALNSLYRSRAFLERAAVPRLQRTHLNLRQASEVAETATHTLLDGLDRALLLIDEFEKPIEHGASPGVRDHAAIQLELRDEVYRLISSLQFQDIAAQQIAYATRVLEDTERRLAALTSHFDVAVFGHTAQDEDDGDIEHHDTMNSTGTATERQAVADSVFGVFKGEPVGQA